MYTHIYIYFLSVVLFSVCFGLLVTFAYCIKGNQMYVQISFLMMLNHRAEDLPRTSLAFSISIPSRGFCALILAAVFSS